MPCHALAFAFEFASDSLGHVCRLSATGISTDYYEVPFVPLGRPGS